MDIETKSVMNVMLLITDEFTYYSLPFIYSLIQNNKWADIKIYLLTDSLNKNNRIVLSDCINSWGGVLHIIDVDTRIYSGLKATSRYPSLLYCKLIPHTFLPENIDRVIYFDVDMIVTGSLEEYYKTDMGHNYFGGCHDVWWFKLLYKGRAIGVQKKYINSGTILYNLELLREANVSIFDYKEFLKDNEQKLYEEWLISNVFTDKIYNFYPFDYNYNPGQRGFYKEYCDNTGVIAKKLVIHYMPSGNDSPIIKPWDAYEYFYNGKENKIFPDDLFNMYKIWWNYAERLPSYIINALLLQIQNNKLKKDVDKISSDCNKWRAYSKTFKYLIQNGLADTKTSHPLAYALLQKNIKNIAIYGDREIAKVLVSLLKGTDVNIAYFVEDKPVKGFTTLKRDTKQFPAVDLMIVADVAPYEKIKTKLERLKVPFKFVNAAEFLQSL